MKFPGTWCHAEKKFLGDEAGELSKGREVDVQQYFDCIERALVSESDTVLIIDLIAPFELHLKMGATTKIYDSLQGAMGGAELSCVRMSPPKYDENSILEWNFGWECLLKAIYKGCRS